MQIAKNTVVSIDYILKGDDGNVIDESQAGDPLVYLHGVGNLVPGLEKGLAGKGPGDQVKVKVAPQDGYGIYDEKLIQKVPRERFGADAELEVGMQFTTRGGHGQVFTVTSIADTEVTLDGNHPLAGATLNFEIKVVEVRAATKEELSHGHVHGHGGHHH